jgi:hypothetical protein
MATLLLDSSNTSLSVGFESKGALLDFTSYEAWLVQSEHMVPETDKLLDLEEFNGKTIAKNINDIILEIKRLKSRYYYSESNDKFSEKESIIKINDNDDDNGFQYQFNIEYVDNKKYNKKKKKKKK